MKAIGYFEKYGEQIYKEFEQGEGVKTVSDMMTAFLAECVDIMDTRHVSTDAGALAVLKEQNQKWNALCSIFEKRKGFAPIVRDGFMFFTNKEIPGVEEAIRKCSIGKKS